MKNGKRLLLGAVALVLAFSLAGCSFRELATVVLKKVISTSDDEEEEVDNKLYASAGGSVALPEASEEFDPTSRIATTIQEGSLYIAFNDITYKSTGYFSTAGTSLTLSSYATTASSGSLQYKLALWQLSADGTSTSYVDGTTVYFTPDGTTQTYTLTGLDPAQQYKITISYDSGSYYVSGGVQVDGVASDVLNDLGADG